MALMPPIPMAGYLVPETPPELPSNFTTVTQALDGGLPATFSLDSHWAVTMRYPTGVLQPWLDADPQAIVSSDALERAPLDPAAPAFAGDPVRIVIARDRAVRAVIPLTASHRAYAVDDGRSGAALEIAIVSWSICAGNVRGSGSFGSFVTLAWRDATTAIDIFATPPPAPAVVSRLPATTHPPVKGSRFDSVTARVVDGELRVLESVVARHEDRWS